MVFQSNVFSAFSELVRLSHLDAGLVVVVNFVDKVRGSKKNWESVVTRLPSGYMFPSSSCPTLASHYKHISNPCAYSRDPWGTDCS